MNVKSTISKILFFLMVFCCFIIDVGSAQVREIPLQDFFKNPEKTKYKISPDGKYFSYLAPYESRLNIFVREVGSEEAKRITNSSERDIDSYFWKGRGRILYLQDRGGNENYNLFSAGIDGEAPKNLTPFDDARVFIISELQKSNNEILIGMNKRDAEIFDVYRVHVETGNLEMAAENPGNISEWIADHKGKLRVAVTTDGVNASILYREAEKEPFREVLKTTFKETVTPLIFTPDNKNIYAISNLGRDKAALVEFDPAAGREVGMIYENPEVDVEGVKYSVKRNVLTSVNFINRKREVEFFDEKIKNIYSSLKREIGNSYEVIIESQNRDEDKFLVRAFSDRSRGSYYFYDSVKDELLKLSDVSPWINEDEMAEMKSIQYTSRDGLAINGYLTLPVGVEAKNLLVVVRPHGGPWSRDRWRYLSDVQFLANRGYAVLQMNFRGSTGYGRDFWEAGFKEWGKAMQDDVTDGVEWLISEGIADRDRIAIYGGSYAGYVVLSGVTFTPDLYRAGIDFLGISSISTWINSFPPYWEPFKEMVYEMVGDPVKDSLLLYETSPLYHTERIKVPLLIMQGGKDPRVKKSESDQMVEALRNNGVEVQYIVKENEGHGFSKEENKMELYMKIEKFLKEHLK